MNGKTIAYIYVFLLKIIKYNLFLWSFPKYVCVSFEILNECVIPGVVSQQNDLLQCHITQLLLIQLININSFIRFNYFHEKMLSNKEHRSLSKLTFFFSSPLNFVDLLLFHQNGQGRYKLPGSRCAKEAECIFIWVYECAFVSLCIWSSKIYIGRRDLKCGRKGQGHGNQKGDQAVLIISILLQVGNKEVFLFRTFLHVLSWKHASL